MTKCPACLAPIHDVDHLDLAKHLMQRADGSDIPHVRWLNQNISRHKIEPPEVARRVAELFDLHGGSVSGWIRSRFIAQFLGKTPHPFVVALQHPTRAVLLGYTIEHQHFLRQWVRSCAYITAQTDQSEVIRYELDNLNTEFGGMGPGGVAHYELLLRMGESLGYPRDRVLSAPPLPATRSAIDEWNRIARDGHWLDTMAAMHSLELIAHRGLVDEGASLHYFDPSILTSEEISGPAKAFLREGYEADVGHSERAFELVNRYAVSLDRVRDVQATTLRSFDLFDDYLLARLERADRIDAAE